MRKIKFRGRDKNGKVIYGDFNDIDLSTIFAGVEDDCIDQLVGYDADGNEVYEGDEVVGKSGTTWVAVLGTTLTLPEFAKSDRELLQLENLKLKEVVRQ